ncbi:MAG: hypothetical protein KDE58_10130, partial [Caldilineaceae bacterium]|nr:hypothetical protein [Caldilineaceae bacterium]
YFAQPNVHVLEEQQWGQCLVRRVMQTAEEPLVRFQTLGGPIQLKGIILGNAEVGAEMPLVLYWQSETAVMESYTVFVHLLDSSGQLVAQQDNLPVQGLAPTDTWAPQTLIRDPYRLTVPATVAPGRYQLHVGLYATDGRVSIAGDGAKFDHIVIDVEVQRDTP